MYNPPRDLSLRKSFKSSLVRGLMGLPGLFLAFFAVIECRVATPLHQVMAIEQIPAPTHAR